MPVKLGDVNSSGCSGDKPWPLLEVATGKKVACGGPSKAEALKALQVRNMAHAGIPVGKGTVGMYVTSRGVQVIEQEG